HLGAGRTDASLRDEIQPRICTAWALELLIDNDNAPAWLIQPLQRRCVGGGGLDGIAFCGQEIFVGLDERRIVVYDEDAAVAAHLTFSPFAGVTISNRAPPRGLSPHVTEPRISPTTTCHTRASP